MAGRLQGKIAFLTAAGAGIGRETAEVFVAEGAKVIATDLDESKLARHAGADCRALDVRSTERSTRWRRRSARSTSCSIAPAMCITAPCSIARIRTGISPSISTSNRCTARSRRSCRQCWRRARGSIVNISSGVSSIRGVPNRYVYGATKAAVIGLTKSRRGRLHPPRHPLQRHLPRHDPKSVARRSHRDARQELGPVGRDRAQGIHRSPADRPARHGARDGQSRALSGIGRKLLHDGSDAYRRRRLRLVM